FIAQLKRIFPELEPSPWTFPRTIEEVVHRSELPLLGLIPDGELAASSNEEKFSPETIERLYGKSLSVSVSALERFASCPFRFFVERGLKVRERDKLQLDVREQGSFQHAVLARFHEEAAKNNREWRQLSVSDARA